MKTLINIKAVYYQKNMPDKKFTLKRQFHEIVDHLFWLKRFDLGHIRTGKDGFANFYVFNDYADTWETILL